VHPSLASRVSLQPLITSPLSISGAVIITADFNMPHPIDVEVAGSSIGPVDTALLTQIVNDLAKTILLPWANYKAQHQVQTTRYEPNRPYLFRSVPFVFFLTRG
jgi:hypothetical protein